MSQLTGILKVKYDTKQVSEKFKSREFVLTTEHHSQYPQHMSLQLTQDKCDIIDKFNIGDELKVSINFRGREWNGPQGIKYFNTLEAWKIEKVGEAQTSSNEQQNTPPNDLPF